MIRALLLLCAVSGLAHARHNDQERIVENSAHTLRANEFSLGIFELGYGITPTLTVSTYLLGWSLALVPNGATAPNVNLKWRFYETADWAFAARLGGLTMDTTELAGGEESRVTIVPIELIGTWRPGDWTLSLALEATQLQLEGEVDLGDTQLDGFGVGSTAMLELSAEWTRSETFAWVIEIRTLLNQRIAADADTTVEIDDRTTIEFFGSGSAADEGSGRTNAVISAFWSWDAFNLKAGLGYGYPSLPFVNLFSDQKDVFPELDLFWRF